MVLRGSVRVRTTAAAVLVVAVALVVGAAALVLAVRSSLHAGAETSAEQRAADLVAQVEAGGLPAGPAEDDPDDPEDVVWQVRGPSGEVVAGARQLPGEHYVVETEDADDGHVVAVAVSLEDVDETTGALLGPLLLGIPVLLLVAGTTTWLVVGRALRPVERIRAEVERISGASLDRRVPEPPGRDELGRLARTMNAMLGRLQAARDRQQQFVADASHELRSPLASLRQAGEVAQAHPGALPDGELAGIVRDEAVRMQALVDQLLVLARTGDGARAVERTEVDLDDLALAEAARVRRRAGGEGPALVVRTAEVGPARVRGDAVALGQVVRNLVDNAARHAAATVALRVAAEGAEGGGVVLAVDDDGPGVPVAERERVFERFHRLDEARARDAGGSGLGLAIVREVVAAHGGTVEVGTSPLGGARFVVRLPG